MLARSLPIAALALLLCAGATGCSGDNLDFDQASKHCGSAEYTAFDSQNHQPQDAYVQAQVDIGAKIDAAVQDVSQASAVFSEVETIYQTTAGLQQKVQARADDHFPDDPNAAGAGSRIDTAITLAIASGKAAASPAEVTLAGEVIDKSLTRFFFLSVYSSLVAGARAPYDEAYGYLGSGPKNDPAARKSLALLAAMRDTDNLIDSSAALFREILDGACALDTRLTENSVSEIDWQSDVAYASHVLEIDRLMTEMLALSVGHEFFTSIAAMGPDEAKVRLYRGGYFFFAIEDKMRALGGQAASDASAIASTINNALNAIESGDPGWQLTFDSDFVRDRVAEAFGVTVKG